jgi:hypothetical protein
MTQKAYELDHDLSRFEEEGVQPYGDGYLAGYFDGWDEVDSAFYKAVPIIFGGNEGKIIGGLDRNNRSTWIVTAHFHSNKGIPTPYRLSLYLGSIRMAYYVSKNVECSSFRWQLPPSSIPSYF